MPLIGTKVYLPSKFQTSDIEVSIVVNGEKFQSHTVTLTLIGQCPMSNSSELFLVYYNMLMFQVD